MSNQTNYDNWIIDGGPAALVIREHLMPVEGHDGVFFPPTFAAGDGFPGGYNIDPPPTKEDPWKKPNVCLIDSNGSQANRIEPIFAKPEYKELIPHIVIKAGDNQINILDIGHRAGDALVRCSELQEDIRNAFLDAQKGNAETLAKIAPTSLVFGVWDSRDTQVKLPRLVSSIIRAYDVRILTRGAVYIPPIDYATLDIFSKEEKAKAEGDKKNPLAKRGFVHNPASGSHGGVIADGGIRRDATLSLAALRLLQVKDNMEQTMKLRRYILGLSLISLTVNESTFLRQGCNLVINPDKPREFFEITHDGKRKPLDVQDALSYASESAKSFGVGTDRTVDFKKNLAKADVTKKEK